MEHENGTQTLELILPWPPSINALWRMGRGRNLKNKPNWYVAKEADEYRERVLWMLRAKKPRKFNQDQRLSVWVWLYPPNKRSFDIDNRFKFLGDILQEAEVIPNDSQIDRLHIVRKEIKVNGEVELRITDI